MPHLNKLYNKHKDDGLVIIGVHSMKGKEKCVDFVKKNKIAYPVAIDHQGKTQSRYIVDGFPDYHVIGRDGKVAIADLYNPSLEAAIEKLLKEPAPKK